MGKANQGRRKIMNILVADESVIPDNKQIVLDDTTFVLVVPSWIK